MAVDLEVHSIHLRRINNVVSSWSAVCCPLLVFKVRKEFPSEQLGSCSVVRLLLLQILFISLGLEIRTVFNFRFQGQAGPPQVHVSTPLQGWIGSLAARGPFWQFLVIARLSIWSSINSSGKIRKHVKYFLKHSLCFPEPVSWQVLEASSEVRSAC